MKILGISGGALNGNNDSMCKEALMGAQKEGATIKFIRLLDLDIKHCTGCNACCKSLMSGRGGICTLKDDFDWLRDQILDADGIIFSIPIFEKGAMGLFRTILDRFGPRADRGMNTIGTKISKEKNGVLPDQRLLMNKVVSYIGLGGSEWVTRIQCDFELLSMILMWKTIHNVAFDWSVNIIVDDERRKQINEIGRELSKAALNYDEAKHLGDSGICPHCHNRNFYLNNNSNEAICCVCGIIGEITVVNNQIYFNFPEEQLIHAHDTMSGKYIHVDDIHKNLEDLNINKKSNKFNEYKNMYKQFIQPTKPIK